MALRNIFNPAKKSITSENFDVTNTLTLREDNYEIKHVLSPINGDYTIKTKSDVTIQKYNSAGTLGDSRLKSYIDNKVQTVENLAQSHTSRIISLENGTNGSAQGLGSVLGVNSDGQNQNITNVNSIGCTTISMDGISISKQAGEFVVDTPITSLISLYAPDVNCENLGTGTGRVNLGQHDGHIMMSFSSAGNSVTSPSNASLEGFSTITNLQNRVATLEAYIENLKRFMNLMSLSSNLIDPNTNQPFNYNNLV